MIIYSVFIILVWNFETIRAQNYGDLRIVQRNITDSSFSAGRLEVYINSTWGTICANNFDMIDAHVACRQLGYSGAISTDTSLHTPYGRGTEGPIWLDDISCDDKDLLHLLSCPNSGIGEHDCDHFSDVAVVCTDTSLLTPPQAMDVRLVGEEYKSQGIVELYCDGQWKILCTVEPLEKVEADAICKQLGYTEARVFETVDDENSQELVQFQQLNCPDGASDIASCGAMCGQMNSSTANRTQCYMSIECIHTVPYGTIRLAQGPGIQGGNITSEDSAAGRVEVFRNGRWGTVCMEGFDLTAANISCQQLGYMRAVKYQNSVNAGFGEGSGPISLSGLRCLPQDEVLALCSKNPANCSHSEDVAVFCTNTIPVPSTDEVPKTKRLSTATFIGIIVGSCFVLLLCCLCLGVCSMHLCFMPYDVKKEQAEHGLYFIEREGSTIDEENETNLDQKLSDLENIIIEDPCKEEDTEFAVLSGVNPTNKTTGSVNASCASLNTIAIGTPISGQKSSNSILTQLSGKESREESPRHATTYLPPFSDKDSSSPRSLASLSLGSSNSSSVENMRPIPIPTKVPISPVLRRQLNKSEDFVTSPRQFLGFTETSNHESDSAQREQTSQDCKNRISASPHARRSDSLQSNGEGSPLLVSQTASTPLTRSPARGIIKSAKSLEAQNMPQLECDQECFQVYTCEEEEEDPALTSEDKHGQSHRVSFRLD